MGVFLKTVVAGVIAASLAGGVIYYGTPSAPAQGSVSIGGGATPGSSQDNGGNIIDRAIKPINDFMRSKKRPENPVAQPPRSPHPGFPQTNNSEGKADEIKYFRLENGEFTEIDEPPRSLEAVDAVNPDASLRILAVMEQAEKIKQSDLRDRAYLDVVDYALGAGLFTPANKAMELIAQVELRDTARSRMAIALARSGDSDGAFKLIDEVEVNELRDIMRLQVIETMVAPPQAFDPGQ